jgi:hypothetical protein
VAGELYVRRRRVRDDVLDLTRGLLLEDTSDLLAWHLHLDVLRGVSNPAVEERSGKGRITKLVWRDRVCLVGLRCSISTSFHHDVPAPTLKLHRLHLTEFTLGVDDLEGIREITDGHRFDWVEECLVERFGLPLDCSEDDYYHEEVEPRYRLEDIREAWWECGPVTVHHSWAFHDGRNKTLVTELSVIPE